MSTSPFGEMLARIARAEVDFVVIGGLAVGAWGVVRGTKDCDVVVDPAPENLDRLAATAVEMGGRVQLGESLLGSAPSIAALLREGRRTLITTQLGDLDVVQGLPNVPPYAALSDHAVSALFEGVAVPVCSLEALRAMKTAAGRPRDLLDLEDLVAAQPPGPGGRSPLAIRPERADDEAAIRRVHERAFAPSTQEAAIVDDLRSEGDAVSELCLVATDEGAVIGHICMSRGRMDEHGPILVLGPMGVLPEHQRSGVGSALVWEALRRAEETDFPLVSVLGHPGYYPRFGFEPAADHGVLAPFDVPAEAWMLYRLAAHDPTARGTVVYAEAFGI